VEYILSFNLSLDIIGGSPNGIFSSSWWSRCTQIVGCFLNNCLGGDCILPGFLAGMLKSGRVSNFLDEIIEEVSGIRNVGDKCSIIVSLSTLFSHCEVPVCLGFVFFDKIISNLLHLLSNILCRFKSRFSCAR